MYLMYKVSSFLKSNLLPHTFDIHCGLSHNKPNEWILILFIQFHLGLERLNEDKHNL